MKMNDKKIWIKYHRKNDMREYCIYRMNQISHTILKKPYKKKANCFAGKRLLTYEETNKVIADAIEQQVPFWTGRYGMTELKLIVQEINKQWGLPNTVNENLQQLCNNAGFFLNKNGDNESKMFTHMMLEASKNIDLHAIWPMNMEDYFVKFCESSEVQLTNLWKLEPWYLYSCVEKHIPLWSSALKGKKVLVIHPFADTIETQYNQKREKIFEKICPSDEILPQFELHTIKAVQTIAGQEDNRFQTWFDALQYMVDECNKVDFDVAIIGCGAYGFPLANEVKKMGKVAIHLGGATQLMFGIMGKRWEHPAFQEFRDRVVNDSWTRPMMADQVKGMDKVENACYW